MKKFKRKYWTNLSWLIDQSGDERAEIYIYKTKSHCRAIMPTGDTDIMCQIEIKEIRR